MSTGSKISICVFGSYARNQNDIYSDKDVLIVADNKTIAKNIITQWDKNNWSVAFYTWKRLKKMSQKGSLFIQHLKQEGLILNDSDGRLAFLLTNYEPKNSYREDFFASEDLIRPLDRISGNFWQSQMQCDVLYTYFRNAGIFELATKGIYEFEYQKIIEQLANWYPISALGVQALLELRIIKTQYRARAVTAIDYTETLHLAKLAASNIFDVKFHPIHSNSPARLLNIPYGTLRDIEARILSYYDPEFLDQLTTGTDIDEYWQSIIDPRLYSWAIKKINLTEIGKLNKSISEIGGLLLSA